MSDLGPSPGDSARVDDGQQHQDDRAHLGERDVDRPHNHSQTLPFSDLFEALFNPLNENKAQPSGRATVPGRHGRQGQFKTSSQEQRRHIIERFIARWRTEVGNDFYPALRLILPDKDRDRGVYGLKENAIGKLLVKLMKIDKNSDDGYSLLHWKLPGQTAASRMAGDFAGRCFEVLAKRQLRTAVGDMRIDEVNDLLDRLAMANGEAEQLPLFHLFYTRMNAQELQWLIRIILKQLKVGATERTILDLWHPDGEALFSVSSSLRRVCWELYDPHLRLERDGAVVTLMQCFQPQLAQFQMPASFQKVVEKLKPSEADPEFWIEEKLDGERMQMHMVEDSSLPGGRRFSFWSRKAKDYTHLYGDGLENQRAALTRYLKEAFADGVQSLILDGEMITWDPQVDKIVAFGTLKTAALATRENPHDEAVARPLFRVFDVLYLNGQPLTRYTLRDRRRALERVVRNVPRRLEIHPYTSATSPDAIEPLLRQVVADASEGLVLKNPRSLYRLNSRNDDWIKVKPEYMSEFGESLDCVVIGAYFGSGRRGGTLSSFLCGLRVSENHIRAGAHPEKCFSFFKVGGGFKAEDYAEIWHHTDGKWTDWDSTNPPTEFVDLAGGDKLQYERPDVWIRAKDSIVLSVKATSVGPSESFAARETLRFPRFRRLRLDRSWDSSLDMDEFQALRSRVDAETREQKDMSIEDRGKRQVPSKRQRRELAIAGRDTNVHLPSTLSLGIFAGMEFCVLSDAEAPVKKSKAQLEVLLKENGGQISQRSVPRPGLTLIADKRVVKVASLVKGSRADVMIRPCWVLDCLALGDKPSLLPYEPRHLFFATEEVERLAGGSTDKFGDSYARDVDADELRGILADVDLEGFRHSSFERRTFLEQLEAHGHGLERLRGALFSRCHVHLTPTMGVARARLMMLENLVRFGGGSLSRDIEDHGITHVSVVADSRELERQVAAQVRLKLSGRTRLARIVGFSWLEKCWNEGTLVDEEPFAPQ